MLLRIRFALFGFACCALAACGGGSNPSPTPAATATPTPTPSPTATPGPITITNSGSTNTAAYTIVVNYNDSATYTESNNTTAATLTAASVSQFYSDVILYSPMSSVAVTAGCTKSASYGPTTTLMYSGSTSGDISCPPTSTSPAQTLLNDAQAIEKQLGLPT